MSTFAASAVQTREPYGSPRGRDPYLLNREGVTPRQLPFQSAAMVHEGSAEREAATASRKAGLIADRHQKYKDRVLRYVTDPASYERDSRVQTKAALDEQQRCRDELRMQQHQEEVAQGQRVLEAAAQRETTLHARQPWRQAQTRETAAANMRAVEAKRAAAEASKAAERRSERCAPEASFMDRFGQSHR